MNCCKGVSRALLVLFALTVPLVSPGAPAATPQATSADFRVDVYAVQADGSRGLSATMAVDEVADLLAPALRGLRDPLKANETALAVLEAHYPVIVDPGHMEYLVRWCPALMDFKVVCIETALLLVVTADETVVVEVEESLSM